MDDLGARFKQEGGGSQIYDSMDVSKQDNQAGVKPKKLSPKSENWKQKYLLMKLERDNLKQENEKLLKKINRMKKKKDH